MMTLEYTNNIQTDILGGEVRDQKCPGTFLNGALGSKIHKKTTFWGQLKNSPTATWPHCLYSKFNENTKEISKNSKIYYFDLILRAISFPY